MSVDRASALPSRPSPGAAGAQLGELYAAHARMVYGVCRMLLRDADEAEDATQQVFLSAYRSLLAGTNVRDPAAWLGTIARNACRRSVTQRSREPYALGDGVTRVSPAADDAAIGREESAALYAQLAVLPEKQREAIVLRDLYGLRYDEVAKALGTSRPAVEALLFRGRRRLQRRLRPNLVAGVLVVPLALRESLAYAVPGFAGSSAPAAAAAAAAGIPLAAKLAAGGSALALVGSGGVVAERSLPDPPARPAETPAATGGAGTTAAGPDEREQPLMPIPAGGFPIARATDDGSASVVAGGDDDNDDEPEEPDERAVSDVDDRDEAKAGEPDDERSTDLRAGDADERRDNLGSGGGGGDVDDLETGEPEDRDDSGSSGSGSADGGD